MEIKEHTQELFLFAEMKQGKEYAFDFFFNYYYPGLCVYAQNMFSLPEEETKNMVQDVFLKFWNDRRKIVITTSVRSYLFVSVKNRSLDYLKKKKRQGTKIEFEGKDFSEEAIDTYVLSELETLFKESLDKLPARCREVFELSRFEGLKNRDIAKQLDISEKTVENQMTKALKILKLELKDYLPLLILFETFHFLK
ncbi:RNA polymerase sigma-70 factor [uncultured Sunxiuqinia sp.]|uniref:RNA polymerase sigma-70 factor n=1 Tax=uncultured Sunxiuqinia sp. TaxID=1573825 RepID=UPI0026136555|nr:RNA polymerase sigma-70 factor [uncultured Sunxiuqinia sp.]